MLDALLRTVLFPLFFVPLFQARRSWQPGGRCHRIACCPREPCWRTAEVHGEAVVAPNGLMSGPKIRQRLRWGRQAYSDNKNKGLLPVGSLTLWALRWWERRRCLTAETTSSQRRLREALLSPELRAAFSICAPATASETGATTLVPTGPEPVPRVNSCNRPSWAVYVVLSVSFRVGWAQLLPGCDAFLSGHFWMVFLLPLRPLDWQKLFLSPL